MDLASPSSLTCVELALWPTDERFLFHMFAIRGHHEIRANGWSDQDERGDVEKNGLPMFVFPEKSVDDSVTFFQNFVTHLPSGSAGSCRA